MIRKKVIYGHSVPYRNMCRFNSGVSRHCSLLANLQFFFRHPLLEQYDYYWRIEPSVKFFCELSAFCVHHLTSACHHSHADYDPFLVMQDQKKVYGFTLSLYEYIETIPSLWATVKGGTFRHVPVLTLQDFIQQHPEHIAEDNAMGFLSDDGGETYNKCHCEC